MKKGHIWKHQTVRDNLAWLSWSFFYALSFPTYSLPEAIWFAFIPVLVFAYIRPIHLTVRYAFLYSLPFFGLTLYWLYGFWEPGLLLMAPLFSVMYAFFFFCIAYIGKTLKPVRWLIVPALWVANELVRSIGFHGFLWNLAGDSQFENLFLIQSADIFGVWGITYLIIMCNSVLAEIVTRMIEKKSFKKGLGKGNLAKLSIFSLIFLANLVYGIIQYRHYDALSRELPKDRLALLQPNMPSRDDNWWKNLWEYYGIFWKLNAESAVQKPDMIVWPETMVKNYVWNYLDVYSPEEDFNKFNARMANISVELNTPVLFTSPTVENDRTYNTADFLNITNRPVPDGKQSNSKIHLVPFGEWLPVYNKIPFVQKIIEKEGVGDFSPSTNFNVIQGTKAKFRVLICYEDVFSLLARIFVSKGVNYFINITNDGWAYKLGFRHPMRQHLAGSTMTAVSVRRPIARAANTGVTGLILPSGKFTGEVGDYKRGFTVVDVPIVPEETLTLFDRFGYLFPYAAALIALGAMITALFFKRRRSVDYFEQERRL